MNRPTVLLVDDCPIMCKFYAHFLQKHYECHTETDSRAALSLIEQGMTPDLIVSDIDMPDLNGIDLIQSIRLHLKDTPILVVSGVGGDCKKNALDAGADDFLAKPFHPAELSLTISRLLKGGQKKNIWQRIFQYA